MLSQISREDQLLLACTRTQLSDNQVAQIQSLAAENLDWPAVVAKSGRQRVLPLLYHHLHEVCPEAVPAAVMTSLQDGYYVHLLRSNMLLGELAKLWAEFGKHDIRVLTFKGAALAVSAYGGVELRQFGDLDLLVDEQDRGRVQRLLESLDFHCAWTSSWEMHLNRRDGLVGVDLHWAFSRLRFAFPLYLDEAWQRREEITLHDQRVSTLGVSDHLLVRCQDAAKDYWKEDWPRLQHICDVAELLRANPALDWQQLVARAGQMRARGTLYLYLILAADLLGASIPHRVLREIDADPQIAPLVRIARQRLAPDANGMPTRAEDDALRRHLFCLRSKEFLPLPPAVAFKLLYALAGLYYRPSGSWVSRFRYWLSDRRLRLP